MLPSKSSWSVMVLALLVACGSPADDGEGTGDDAAGGSLIDGGDDPDTGGGGGGDPDAAGGGGGPDAGGGGGDCVAGTTQCSNCVDDDGDGRIDGLDVECTSAADDDESSYATGISGDNMDATWQDCFFDGNSGAGDDGCRYNTCCLIGGCDPGAEADSCTATQECIDTCGGVTVPGCDCFGCCTMCDALGCVDVVTNPAIAPNCDYDSIHDPVACPVCTLDSECGSPCGGQTCVLCPGQDPSDLPAECTTQTCPDGQTSCETTSDCGPSEFCSNFCCIIQVN